MFLKKGGKKIKGKERRVSIWKRFKQIKGQHWCEHIPPLITFLYKQQLRYAHALIGTNSRGKNASCRHRRRTCTFVLFLENHAHYSIKYFLIDRSLPLPVSFIHWLYAILIIQEEITRMLSKSLHFFPFLFLFLFFFTQQESVRMFNTVAVFQRITVWLWRPFDSRRNED